MTTPPTFSVGQTLTSAAMNSVGLWLVKSQTVGTGVSSVTVTGAFSADYDNYLIVGSGIDASAGNQWITIQVGSAVTSYYWAGSFVSVLGAGSGFFNGNPAGDTRVPITYSASQVDTTFSVQVSTPFSATPTKFLCTPAMGDSYVMWTAGAQTSATSHTSFTISDASGGTLTGGTIRVYGYRN